MRSGAINDWSTLSADYGGNDGTADELAHERMRCETRHENGHGFIGGIE